MPHVRLVFRGLGAVALTIAVLSSLLMPATASVDSCPNYYLNFRDGTTRCCVATGACETSSCVENNLGKNFNCNQNECDGVQCVPVLGCDPNSTLKCLGNTACDDNATSCAGIPTNTICFFDGSSGNFKICDGCVTPVDGQPQIAPSCFDTPSPPSPQPPSPSPPEPSPPSPSPFPPSPSPPSPFPPSPPPSPPSPNLQPGFPFCVCNRTAANTPFDFILTSVSSDPVTTVTGSFRVRPCNANGNSCCNMDLNKVEFLSGDRCQGSVQAVFVDGVSRSWSWQIYGPGRFVFKITNLALSAQVGPNYAEGVVLQIVLKPGSACPSFDTFFPGRVYSFFNARKNCCPVAPLRLPVVA